MPVATFDLKSCSYTKLSLHLFLDQFLNMSCTLSPVNEKNQKNKTKCLSIPGPPNYCQHSSCYILSKIKKPETQHSSGCTQQATCHAKLSQAFTSPFMTKFNNLQNIKTTYINSNMTRQLTEGKHDIYSKVPTQQVLEQSVNKEIN